MNSAMTSPKLDTLLSHAGLLGEKSASKRDDFQNRNLEGSIFLESEPVIIQSLPAVHVLNHRSHNGSAFSEL